MEMPMLLRAVAALVLVLGLLLLLAVALRMWGGKLGLVALSPDKGGGKKIQLLEATMLDSRHRLVRVRMENREHLILLGGASPVVVESREVKESG
ncbi:MAG: flagellar biosynthetic protein FliO [Proteobacteria bacterium]|nr:flagellar biosynthetic protein FliO [Pseudomonadota bacterium]